MRRWWVVALFIAVLIACVPALWIVALHVGGVRFSTAQDPFGFLATLAAIVGAIFTAAGLVTALAAVITVLTVDDKVNRAIEDRMPDFVDQMDKQIEANFTFLQARSSGDWHDQNDLARRAVDQHPKLQHKVSLYIANHWANMIIANFGTSHTRLAVNYTGPRYEAPPPSVVLPYIWQAQASGDDPSGEMAALEALMHAADGAYTEMVKAIRRGKQNSQNRILEYLTTAPRLALLVSACGYDPELRRMKDLGDLLDHRLPRERDEILHSIEGIVLTDQAGPTQAADWIVIGRQGQWLGQDMDHFPVTVHIKVFTPSGSDRVCAVNFIPGHVIAGHGEVFPNALQQVQANPPQSSPPMEPQVMVNVLDRLLLFICRDTTEWRAPTVQEPPTAM